jgi:hypothetical protein
MKAMKRPRNFDTHYETAKSIANQLREMAIEVESRGGFAKVSVTISLWDPEWENPQQDRRAIMTSITLVNKKAGHAMGLDR